MANNTKIPSGCVRAAEALMEARFAETLIDRDRAIKVISEIIARETGAGLARFVLREIEYRGFGQKCPDCGIGKGKNHAEGCDLWQAICKLEGKDG